MPWALFRLPFVLDHPRMVYTPLTASIEAGAQYVNVEKQFMSICAGNVVTLPTLASSSLDYGYTGAMSRPAVSGSPMARFKFCTACPAAPFTRLSRQLTTISVPVRWSIVG